MMFLYYEPVSDRLSDLTLRLRAGIESPLSLVLAEGRHRGIIGTPSLIGNLPGCRYTGYFEQLQIF